MMISIIIFEGCVDDKSVNFSTCVSRTSVPLIFVLIIVFFKVSDSTV